MRMVTTNIKKRGGVMRSTSSDTGEGTKQSDEKSWASLFGKKREERYVRGLGGGVLALIDQRQGGGISGKGLNKKCPMYLQNGNSEIIQHPNGGVIGGRAPGKILSKGGKAPPSY